jgi:predicted TIM-barrel fold metal-dependent hydrolase
MHACPGPDRTLRKPRYVAPPGATDCHAHIFGPQARYPFAVTRNYTPEDCSIDEYRSLLATLGLSRGVLVQGGAHGTDNRVTLDAIATDRTRLRGVAVIRPGLEATEIESQLASMHDGGIRGARLSSIVGGSFDQLNTIARQTYVFGWHLLLHFQRSTELVELEPVLRAIPNDFVLDHLGRIRADESLNSASYRSLLRLLDTDRCWIKLASLYRLSLQPYPFLDMLPMIHDVVARRPNRVIWGSNWPHPICPTAMPNDADLVDLIPLWLPEDTVQHQVLVENPEALYGFSPSTRGLHDEH